MPNTGFGIPKLYKIWRPGLIRQPPKPVHHPPDPPAGTLTDASLATPFDFNFGIPESAGLYNESEFDIFGAFPDADRVGPGTRMPIPMTHDQAMQHIYRLGNINLSYILSTSIPGLGLHLDANVPIGPILFTQWGVSAAEVVYFAPPGFPASRTLRLTTSITLGVARPILLFEDAHYPQISAVINARVDDVETVSGGDDINVVNLTNYQAATFKSPLLQHQHTPRQSPSINLFENGGLPLFEDTGSLLNGTSTPLSNVIIKVADLNGYRSFNGWYDTTTGEYQL